MKEPRLSLMIGRRAALGLLGPLAVPLGAIGQTAAPTLLRDRVGHRYTPRDFGCIGDGVADDTVGLDTALRWLAARRLPLWLDRGTYRMAPATRSWGYLGLPTHPTWRAALIDYHDFHLIGAGGRIVLSPPEDSTPGMRWYAFATGLNLQPGAIRNVTLEGAIFDLDEEFSRGRGGACCALVGVDGVTIRRALIQNSARSIRGHGVTLHGCTNVQVHDFSIRHLQQGLFAAYVDGVAVTNIHADRFTEALDFDFGCRNIRVTGGNFTDSTASRQSQCIDLAASDAVISNITAARIPGNIIGCYTKQAWGSLAEHVAMQGQRAADPMPASRILIDGVRGTDIGGGSGYPAIFFNLRRRGAGQAGFAVAQDQVARNITLTRSSGVAVREGTGCRLEELRLTEITSGPQTGHAAIWIGQADSGEPGITESRLSGNFRNLTVLGTNHHGILVDGMADGSVRGLRVEGFGAAPGEIRQREAPFGIGLRNLSRKPGAITLAGLTVIDTHQTGFPCLQLSDSGNQAPVPGKSIMDEGGHRLVGGLPLRVSGGGHLGLYWRPGPPVPPLRRDATSAVLHKQIRGQARWIGATLTFEPPVHTTWPPGIVLSLVKRAASGAESSMGQFRPLRGAQPVGARLDVGEPSSVTSPEATLLPGDELLLRLAGPRAGELDLRMITVRLALLEYAGA
jgi:hypothetical protein